MQSDERKIPINFGSMGSKVNVIANKRAALDGQQPSINSQD